MHLPTKAGLKLISQPSTSTCEARLVHGLVESDTELRSGCASHMRERVLRVQESKGSNCALGMRERVGMQESRHAGMQESRRSMKQCQACKKAGGADGFRHDGKDIRNGGKQVEQHDGKGFRHDGKGFRHDGKGGRRVSKRLPGSKARRIHSHLSSTHLLIGASRATTCFQPPADGRLVRVKREQTRAPRDQPAAPRDPLTYAYDIPSP